MIWWLAQNTAVAALLACVVFGVCRLGRLGPAARHALWLLVLVKLIMPPIFTWPWDVPNVWPAGALTASVTPVSSEENEAPPPNKEARLANSLDLEQEMVANGAFLAIIQDDLLHRRQARNVCEANETATTETDRRDDAPRPLVLPLWLPPAAFYLWLIGVAAMALLQAARLTRLGRLLKLARPGPRWLLRQVRHLGGMMGVRTPLALVVPGAGSPVVCGIGRPRLLWPARLLDTLPAGSRRSVVAHELAHLRRRDHWVGWLLLAAECIWWWNPLFWLIRRQVRNQAELACDAWVVATLPGDRRAYAEALIEVSRLVSTAAVPVPAVGMSGGPRQAFTERLTMIMRDGAPCKLSTRGCLFLVGLAVVLLPGWSLAQKEEKKTEDRKRVEVRVIAVDGKNATHPEKGTAQPRPEKGIDVNALGNVIRELDADVLANVLAWQATPTDSDRKLQELEKKLEAMLKELRELRAAKPNAPPTVQPPAANRTTASYQLRRAGSAGQPAEAKVIAGEADLAAAIKQLEEAIAKNPALKEPLQKAIDALRSVEKNVPTWRKLGEQVQIQGRLVPPQATTNLEKPKTPAASPPVVAPARSERRIINLRETAETSGTPATTITLSRTTYKMENKAKADALATFIKEHIKAAVLEVKTEGESLTITTTPETQKAIGQLISLTGGEKTKTSSAPAPPTKSLGEKWKAVGLIDVGAEVEVVPALDFIKKTEEKKSPEKP
jgi:beta-lactamase regulating signal transducer with metallopeptidase domain